MRWLQQPLVLTLFLALVLTACSSGGPAPSLPVSTDAPFATIPVSAEPLAATPTFTPLPNITLSPQPASTVSTPLPPVVPVPGIELNSLSAAHLELAGNAGAHWVRRNSLDWSLVEPQEGARNWDAVARLEAELEGAAQAGLEVVLVVRGTPAWAQAAPGISCGPVLPDKLPAFAQFMHDVVARYAAAPYSVLYWELGNEPDIDPAIIAPDSPFGCQGDASDEFYGGEAYAQMLKQVYPQIKTAAPDAQVLVGGLLMDCDPRNPPKGKDCTSSFFLKGILRAGGGDYFDGVSFHAYDYYIGADKYGNGNWGASWDTTGPVLIPKTRYLRDLLDAHGYAEKYLLNTEAGLLCGQDGSDPTCQSEEFLRTKATYVALTHTMAQIFGLRANIWYSLSGWRGTGLITREGVPTPALEAFQIAAGQLHQAAYTRTVGDYPGVRAYEFLRDGRRVLLLVSQDGLQHAIKFRTIPAAVLPVYGEAVKPAERLTVGPVPIFVEFAP